MNILVHEMIVADKDAEIKRLEERCKELEAEVVKVTEFKSEWRNRFGFLVDDDSLESIDKVAILLNQKCTAKNCPVWKKLEEVKK